MGYTVPVSACPLLQDPPFVLALLLLGAAVGYRCLRLLRVTFGETSLLERGVLSSAVGLGLLQYLPYTLGMAHRLTPATIRIGLLLLLLATARDMARIVIAIRQATLCRAQARLPGWMKIGILLALARLLPTLLTTLCPPIDGDGLGYHLAAPKRWLQSGDLRYLPTLVHTSAPMGVEMLYTTALAVWSDTAAKLIHFALGTLTLTALFVLGRRLHGAAAGFAAAALWCCGWPSLSAVNYFSIAFVDMGLAFEVTAAVLAWAVWQRTRISAWLWCAALCAGFAASFKLTGVFVGIGLGGITFAAMRLERAGWKQSLRQSALLMGLALLPALPWLLRTWLLTGNPVAPMLSGLFPTRDWNPEAAQAFQTYFRYFNLWGPANWGLEERRVILYSVIALAALLYVVLLWRARKRETRLLIGLTGFLLLTALAFTGLAMRLLSHVTPLLFLLSGLWLSDVLARSRFAQTAILTLLAVNLALFLLKSPYLPLEARTALGRTSRLTYLTRRLTIFSLWETLNRLPDDGRPVLVAALQPADSTTSGLHFYCNRDCLVTDAYLQARIRMDTWEHYLSDIRRDRIGYIIAPKRIVPGYVRIGPDYAPARNEFPFARRLVETHGRRLAENGNYELYRLETSP